MLNHLDGRPEAAISRDTADLTRIAALEAQLDVGRHEIATLKVALKTARRIGAAIGIVMANAKLTEPEAFDVLRVASQTGNRKLREVADYVVETGEVPTRGDPGA